MRGTNTIADRLAAMSDGLTPAHHERRHMHGIRRERGHAAVIGERPPLPPAPS